MGIWSCIGKSLAEVSESLRNGRSGIGIAPDRTDYGYQSPLSGIVPTPDLSHIPLRNAQRKCIAEQTAYALMAVRQAIDHARLTDLSRVALIVSNDSTAEGAATTEAVMERHHDSRRLGGFHVFRSLNSTTSMSLASILGIGGLSLTVSAACAGGGHAVGLAATLIESGTIDCAIVVGCQEVGTHSYTAFDALGVFSRNTTSPATASRPFDIQRDGLVPSGGAAAIILESPDHLSSRLAENKHRSPSISADASSSSIVGESIADAVRPLARVAGYGFSTSPDIVSPSPDSILASMYAALGSASIYPRDLTAIFAHATSTCAGDTSEANALTRLLYAPAIGCPPAENVLTVPIIATKALTGHECWMSGVSQIVYALVQIHDGFLMGNPNLTTPDPAATYLYIPSEATTLAPSSPSHILCNAFGFGGTNSTLILSIE